MFIGMIAMGGVQMAIMQIIDVIFMTNRGVAALSIVRMRMRRTMLIVRRATRRQTENSYPQRTPFIINSLRWKMWRHYRIAQAAVCSRKRDDLIPRPPENYENSGKIPAKAAWHDLCNAKWRSKGYGHVLAGFAFWIADAL